LRPVTHPWPQPNGRFEVNTKICLSISTHHPEHWQPSWSLRTALVALTAFFPTKGDGAIGALAYSADERRALAAASRLAPPASGQSEARQAVATAAHARLLASEGQGPSAFTQDAAIAAAAASITRSAIAAVLAQNECRPQAPSPLRPAPPSPAVAPSPLPAAAPFPLRAAAPDATERRREDDTPLLALAAALSVAILALLVRRLLAWLGGGGVAGLALVAADAGLAAHEAGMLQ
jgi:ubiquitin-conjugating enzyme E2 J1